MDNKTAQKILEQNARNFNIIAEEFSASRSYLWPGLKEFKKFVKKGDKILDVGCGNGRLYTLFQGSFVKYVGIDSSQKLIEIARKKFQTKNSTNFGPKFIVGNILDLPFPNSSFDVLFSIAVLHHIPSHLLRKKAIKECGRVLKPNGIFILTVWNLFRLKLLIKYRNLPIIFGYRRRKLDFGDTFIPWKTKRGIIYRYYHSFRKREIKKLLEDNFLIKDIYWTNNGKRSNFFQGTNLVVIAKKKT